MALFFNQSRNVPPCTASPKFESDRGQGRPYGLSRY